MEANFKIVFGSVVSRAQVEEIAQAFEAFCMFCGVTDFQVAISEESPRLSHFKRTTARERQVLKMLAEGISVPKIASELNLSVKTVEAHKFNLMRKLNLHNKVQLVMYAIQQRIIHIPNMA